jgi:hypothetical protein
MTATRPSYPRLVSAALGLVACGAALAVAQTPIPSGAERRVVGVAGSGATVSDIAQQTGELIEKLVTDYYPTVKQGASPINRITFVLDADGNYVTSAAWTDTLLLRQSTATTPTAVAGVPIAQEVRMVLGAGVAGGGNRRVPSAGTGGGAGVGDFGAYGFPNITSDAVMSTQSGRSFAPKALSVFVIRLKK